MSGEVVAFPVVALLPVAGIVGIVAVGSAAARAVQSIVDHQVEAARKKAEEERHRLREWEDFQGRQRQKLEEASRLQNELRQAESRLAGIGLGDAAEAGAWERRAPSYAGGGKKANMPHDALRSELQRIGKLLQELPESFRLNPHSPYERMEEWHAKLASAAEQSRSSRPETASTLRETILRTFRAYIEKEEAESRKQKEMYSKVNNLIEDVMLVGQLAGSQVAHSELRSIRTDLLHLLSAEVISPGQIQLIEKCFNGIRQRVDDETAMLAGRRALAESLTRHLSALGYRTIADFSDHVDAGFSEALLAMPGGERVRIRIAADGGMACQLMHESRHSVDALSREVVALFKRQETKWCTDFKEVIRRMTAEGFLYEVKFEQEIPLERIPVVVMETADELARWKEDREEEDEMERFQREDQRRYLE
ncbi:hypothetical protein [Desulforhabdus sp. TSK]|uniref:hypothetical protein n=1 Tax=Desulforhabdus sp. TSK TaxID=2925014 RepID=UPI001FC86556|nr:hypothetical protein [Desulforhabdus sp. TSK]GKT09130.1 hypothetical protein DSTSK_24350 [Desulforhabdus sp. TSK]